MTLSLILTICYCMVGAIEFVFIAVFALVIANKRRQSACLQASQWPKVSVVVPLRGVDPKLRLSLEKLLVQDYPDYEVRLVVDSTQDPAWELVHSIDGLTTDPRFLIQTILQRRNNCGLTCAAIAQGIRSISSDSKVIVFLDGDAAVDVTILKRLVTPLHNPKVAVSFGNRWYRPESFSLGSSVRMIWNAAAVIPMWFFEIPWGGCMAIRRDALEAADIPGLLERAMVHDAPLLVPIHRAGYSLEFVPSLILPNPETCDVSFSLNFMTRQMLWTKLYHPSFTNVLIQAFILFGLLFSAIALILSSVFQGDWFYAGWMSFVLIAYLVWSTLMTALLDAIICRSIRASKLNVPRTTWLTWLTMPVAILWTHWIYGCSLLLASCSRRIKWRGIRYEIKSPFDVSIIADEPFQQEAIANSSRSI